MSLSFLVAASATCLGGPLGLAGSILRALFCRISPAAGKAGGDDALQALGQAGPLDGLLDDLGDRGFEARGVFRDALVKLAAFLPLDALFVFVFGRLEHHVELAARDAEFGLVLEVELVAERFREAAHHVPALDRVHVLGELSVRVWVVEPGPV